MGEQILQTRTSGKRTVKVMDQMLEMVTGRDQSRLREFAGDYRAAWKQFDLRDPTITDRNNLKSAGNDVLKHFKPSGVNLK